MQLIDVTVLRLLSVSVLSEFITLLNLLNALKKLLYIESG